MAKQSYFSKKHIITKSVVTGPFQGLSGRSLGNILSLTCLFKIRKEKCESPPNSQDIGIFILCISSAVSLQILIRPIN